MKAFRIILIVLLSIIIAYSGYATIGYILWGNEMPIVYGDGGNTVFTGMYLMSATFGGVLLVATILLIIVCVRLHKSNKK